MTSTRLALATGLVVDLFSLFADWLAAGGGHDPYYSYPVGFSLPNLFSPQRIPANVSSTYYPTYAQSVVVTSVSGDLTLLVAFIVFVVSLLVGIVALFRWQVSAVSGVLTVAGAMLWLAGVPAVAPGVAAALDKWPGFAGTNPGISVGASVGPYIALAGGIVLVSAFVLTKVGKLDQPG